MLFANRWYLIAVASIGAVYMSIDRTDYTTPHKSLWSLDHDVTIPKILVSDDQNIFDRDQDPILFNKKDFKCMVDNIFYEAGTDNMVGKLAVAQVTVNRVKLGYWGETVCDVVHADHQFSWTKMDTEEVNTDSKNYKESIWAAEQILHKNIKIKPLQQALFYHADYAKPKWIDHSKYVGKFGKHIYYDGAKGSWLSL